MVDLTPYREGIELAVQSLRRHGDVDLCRDPRTAFRDHLLSLGFSAPSLIEVEKIIRMDSPDDSRKGRKSGWYIYREIQDSTDESVMIGLASYGDWKAGSVDSWCSKADHRMTTKERLNYYAQREAMRAQREAEEAKRHQEASIEAYRIWSDSRPIHELSRGEQYKLSPYLARKQVLAYDGVRLGDDGRLIVPLAVDNQVSTLEYIFPDGQKRRLTGGRAKGAWFKIEADAAICPNSAIDNTIYICEGYSTAASLHEATGRCVYAAMNAGNLFEVASHVSRSHRDARIIIAGDDDTQAPGNPGRTKAEQVAAGIGAEAVFPAAFNDFNDMAVAQGIDAVRSYLMPLSTDVSRDASRDASRDVSAQDTSTTTNARLPSNVPANVGGKPKALLEDPMPIESIGMPQGTLQSIVQYYNATAGNPQPGFAIQTSLALASIIAARGYRTSLDNFPSLYLLNVAKSSTGKEHGKTVIERILYEANLTHLISGDGYTSAGAVFSALLDNPRHITVIDEFGRYLEAGRDMRGGNHHQREANTKLMESIGRGAGVLRPPTYSTMTLKKDQADAIKNRFVYNPAITILAMTTPDTLFKTLDMGAIKDGFINRFIISISDAARTIRKHKPPIDVPQSILDWIYRIEGRHGKRHNATEKSECVTLEFSQDAFDAQVAFQEYCIERCNYLEQYGMAELPGRSNEMAMKISLIHALSRDPGAIDITDEDMSWAIDYVKSCLETTIARLKFTISHSEFEQAKKDILSDLRKRYPSGITWADMQKKAPYSQYERKTLKEILDALKDADLAADEPHKPETGRGRPTTLWTALES